jgi:hypothetical protein
VKEADKLFVGSMPALYDRHLGPFIFEPYAQDLAERVVRFAPGVCSRRRPARGS